RSATPCTWPKRPPACTSPGFSPSSACAPGRRRPRWLTASTSTSQRADHAAPPRTPPRVRWMPMRRPNLARVRPQAYIDPRPAEHFQRYHEYARGHQPDRLYALVKGVSVPYCRAVYKLEAQQIENVPVEGPIILAPN